MNCSIVTSHSENRATHSIMYALSRAKSLLILSRSLENKPSMPHFSTSESDTNRHEITTTPPAKCKLRASTIDAKMAGKSLASKAPLSQMKAGKN